MSARYRIAFTPEARNQLAELDDYITAASSPGIARRFTNGILDHVAGFAEFPHRGTPRDGIRPGLRTTTWRRRVTIAYAVDGDVVVVLGLFYGGQDFVTLLGDN
ncbi:MAG: type II toxin-antitoxin system RelE/ParE family toxin [Sphingomonadales bacterium]|nr:type II toxin-antitoxin system RelE/ParE family toxin [Sphingomonadales bacterium]MDE2170256.1 type II toxin-antitoxin system RelE/ParE family toxin [Sphingomonadales bacterium]